MINKKSCFKMTLLTLTLVLLLATLLSGCSGLQSLLQNPNYLYENGAVLVDGADKPIELKNNPKAIPNIAKASGAKPKDMREYNSVLIVLAAALLPVLSAS